MSTFLPMFPLSLVVYPGEKLNLHIFEERYQQLVNESLETGQSFGIPTFLGNKLADFGTEVKVAALHQRYEDGQMDISTQGIRTFKLDDFQNPVAGKLYAGGDVTFQPEYTDLESASSILIHLLETLYGLLATPVEYDIEKSPFSFQIAHKVGLAVEEEYKLLTLQRESERQDFLIQHLQKVIPIVTEMEQTKNRIRMNGHFKNLDPLNF